MRGLAGGSGARRLGEFQFRVVCGPRAGDGGSAGRQTHAVEDLLDRFGRLDGGQNAESAATPGTFEHVDPEHPAEKLSPGVVGQVGQPLNQDNKKIVAWYDRVKERPSAAAEGV